jgi:hypothetical protein
MRVATPSTPTSNGATTIKADRAIVASHDEASTSVENILKGISTISGKLQHAAVVAEVRILARRFKVEVVPKS